MNANQSTGIGLSARWWTAMVVGLATMVALSAPAQAQEPVDCGRVEIKLADLFPSPICYRTSFRGGGTIGRTQSAHGESRDYMIHFQSSKSGAGQTYLYRLSFDELMDYYGLSQGQRMLSPEQPLSDGFDYVSVGGKGLDSCVLFLKQVGVIRDGYRRHYFGLACDKGRDGAYSPSEAQALLDLVKDY